MLIYWIALILSCFLSLLFQRSNKNSNISHLKVFICFLPLFLLALFRWNVGVDVVYGTGYYYKAYNAVQLNLGNIFDYETGFYSLMVISNLLGFSLYHFYCLLTILFFYFFTKYISKFSNNLILCILLFVLSDLYLFTFSTLRQSLGIAFGLIPVLEIISNEYFYKSKKWWGLLVLSISMHLSLLYLYIILFLAKIKFKKKQLIYFTIILCLSSPFLQGVYSIIISSSSYFSKYVGSNMDTSSFSITYFGISLILFVISMLNYDKIIKYNSKFYQLINFCSFTTIFMLNSQLLIMPYRIFPLFVPVYLILCDSILLNIKKNSVKYFIVFICILVPFLLLFVNQYYFVGGNEFFSYNSIFDYKWQVFPN